jgi:hypothetical protein
MKALTNTFARFAPPLWLTLALAVGLGAALLAAFVDTLHQNVRHGEEFRQWQRVGMVRQTAGTASNAPPRVQAPQWATSVAPNFQQ